MALSHLLLIESAIALSCTNLSLISFIYGLQPAYNRGFAGR